MEHVNSQSLTNITNKNDQIKRTFILVIFICNCLITSYLLLVSLMGLTNLCVYRIVGQLSYNE